MNESFLRDIVILYSPPKVGSTSIVTSIRLFASDKFIVFHTHDDKIVDLYNDRLKVINVTDIVTNNIIFNKTFNRERKIYIIDIYRTPIERKISEFFQKISEKHFNNTEKEISKYNIDRLFKRFNDIYPYFEDIDFFNDIYDIDFKIEKFDCEKKYVLYEKNNIVYLKLRLSDSNYWGGILSKVLGCRIDIIHDYNTFDKDIGAMYKIFKGEYKLPINFYNDLVNDKNINIYLNSDEKEAYLNFWFGRLAGYHKTFSKSNYEMYQLISNENKFYDSNVMNIHYGDDGCLCDRCCNERKEIIENIGQKQVYIRHPYDENYNNKIMLSFFLENEGSHETYSTVINLVNIS
jgi:hypothetical protein